MTEPVLPIGIYQRVRTNAVQALGEQTSGVDLDYAEVSAADGPTVLGRHIGQVATTALEGLRKADRLAAANHILSAIAEIEAGSPLPSQDAEAPAQSVPEAVCVANGLRELVAVRPHAGAALVRPTTPLKDAALLTNGRDEPNIGHELAAELGSADRVDILMAFVKFAGINAIEAELRSLLHRDVPVRLITTTYCGATERRALDKLVDLGVQVKVRYETSSTRLHAKAWLFSRDSGYDTAYIGSSNLSHSALHDGMEWNVRIGIGQTSPLLTKFRATFETYWADDAFVDYQPERDADRLDRQLASARGQKTEPAELATISGLEVQPYPHQRKILEALDAERTEYDRHENLIVAATGTGKTVVAALDYRRLWEQMDTHGRGYPRLLFVAHREEILTQARQTYREVLMDPTFGELLVGGQVPTHGDHVFASIQSLRNVLGELDYDIIVIDEFHHAAASSYRQAMARMRYRELLGMTATPERADGSNVKELFGGYISYELRLWDALDADLLSPFHYYGVSDGTDLSALTWSQGKYRDDELDNLFTGNDARLRIILKNLNEKVVDPRRMRALGFCVSIDHAEYMAREFTNRGVPAKAVTSRTSAEERKTAFAQLRTGTLACLFGVDVFNEGLDIPKVDTLLMLRPTQSPTVFLQQLGRGLRRAENKALTTVLDFVGLHREEFDLSLRFTAMVGKKRKQLEEEVADGFPQLPSGCRIILDSVTRAQVLANVKKRISVPGRTLAMTLDDMADPATVDLGEFLDETGFELPDLYRGNRSWTGVREAAGLLTRSPAEHRLGNRMSGLAHVDDAVRARAYADIVTSSDPLEAMAPERATYAHMLLAVLYRDQRGGRHAELLEELRESSAVAQEITELMDHLAQTHVPRIPRKLELVGANVPLYSHAFYRREELLAAFGWLEPHEDAPDGKAPQYQREGVLWSPRTQSDVFFVTLNKSGRRFSPTTMYRDYAISRDVFHWESQSTTPAASPTGQRYQHHADQGSNVVLALRTHPDDEIGGGAPFFLAGPMTFLNAVGEKPMSITWKLHRPLPEEVFAAAQVDHP